MAIDTAEKRYSIIAFGDGNQILFEPDAAVDLDDQQHLLGCYSGIAFDSPAAPPANNSGTQLLVGII